MCQLDHFPRRILAGPVPVDHRSRSEAVPQIVDAGTTPVAPLGLRFTQANALTHMCKVVARAAIAEPASIAFHKEWNRSAPQQPVPLGNIGAQLVNSGPVDGKQATLAKLPERKSGG